MASEYQWVDLLTNVITNIIKIEDWILQPVDLEHRDSRRLQFLKKNFFERNSYFLAKILFITIPNNKVRIYQF